MPSSVAIHLNPTDDTRRAASFETEPSDGQSPEAFPKPHFHEIQCTLQLLARVIRKVDIHGWMLARSMTIDQDGRIG